MGKVRLRGPLLTGLVLTWLVAQACSGGVKKKILQDEAGAEAGSDGGPTVDSGVDAGIDSGVDAGVDSGIDAGVDSGVDAGVDSGIDAGVPQTPAKLLFSVAPAANGAVGSGVASLQTKSQSAVYSSTTEAQAVVPGTNDVILLPGALGIQEGDQLDAFSVLRDEPLSPVYLFSLPDDGAEGGSVPTRLYREYSAGGSLPGDVFFTDGVQSFLNLGEGGEPYGYNGLLASQRSLGLVNPNTDPNVQTNDNLTGLYALRSGETLTEVYFSVSPSSLGVAGTAVANTPIAEMGCTIFKSPLDGTNSVAFTCADLGLAGDTDVDALAVFGKTTPSKVLFSLAGGVQGVPQGLAGTGVETMRTAQGSTTAGVFSAPVDGSNSNTTLLDYIALGLTSSFDNVDALAVLDIAPPAVTYGGSCTLSVDPLSADAGLGSFSGATNLGNGVVVLRGFNVGTVPEPDSYLAYDAKTCAFLQRILLPPNALGAYWTIVPLAGWTAAQPLSNVEFWTSPGGPELSRYDQSGALLDTYPLSNVTGGSIVSLEYVPAVQSFLAEYDGEFGEPDYQLYRVPLPAAATPDMQEIPFTQAPINHPCASGQILGTDSNGLSYILQPDNGSAVGALRVCPLTPTGEFAGLPFTWTPNVAGDLTISGLMPGNLLYALHTGNLAGPFTIEHAIFSLAAPLRP